MDSESTALDAPKLDPCEEHHWIASPHEGLRLFLSHLAPARPRHEQAGPVLYVHGATFPSALSIAYRFDGYSWRDALCEAGFDVWGLDFLGYGHSGRYPEFQGPPDAYAPLGRADDAGRQIEAAARFILKRQGGSRLAIIAHSWGTMAAGRFAASCPELVSRMVLFGPIARRSQLHPGPLPAPPAWRLVTVDEQLARFTEDVPSGEPPVLSARHFQEWGERYLDSDPQSRSRTPAAVMIPMGPVADIASAWHGALAYDPAAVQAPVAIIRGEWDGLTPDEDAGWLFDALCNSPHKRDIKIGRATHLMHLEQMRFTLYRESIAFLLDDTIAIAGGSMEGSTPARVR